MEDKCAIAQAEEVELLQSMYSEGELTFGRSPSDHEAVQPSSYTIQVNVDVGLLDIEFRVPEDYPYKNFPTVFIRGHGAFHCDRINSDLRDWIHQQQLGLPLVAEIISWLIENNSKYRTCQGNVCDERTDSHKDDCAEEFSRYYILSHHLRSPLKVIDFHSNCCPF
ncbi:RWD domain protein [Teladorsagia circumcincta]|uniref:RWD domain protein n=1 Tax=Teladorsagia circumcincta TaxID=45464 RepID=A0A2G9UXR6_TELCI|nr:RWD domain protein [Teladorsagia circumcincta]